eukprot:TRINITY_DN3675_c0_g1_i1.p1 TRINITY_DN3675_c0_g1~~TRINITY_DN3675_c0_g1_i1.p1  ORF type:complete len:244 (+),score=39.32 TRINITY_DN3675_c0_g1_i1:1013-1744(+)
MKRVYKPMPTISSSRINSSRPLLGARLKLHPKPIDCQRNRKKTALKTFNEFPTPLSDETNQERPLTSSQKNLKTKTVFSKYAGTVKSVSSSKSMDEDNGDEEYVQEKIRPVKGGAMRFGLGETEGLRPGTLAKPRIASAKSCKKIGKMQRYEIASAPRISSSYQKPNRSSKEKIKILPMKDCVVRPATAVTYRLRYKTRSAKSLKGGKRKLLPKGERKAEQTHLLSAVRLGTARVKNFIRTLK